MGSLSRRGQGGMQPLALPVGGFNPLWWNRTASRMLMACRDSSAGCRAEAAAMLPSRRAPAAHVNLPCAVSVVNS